MPGLPLPPSKMVGQDDAIPDGFVVPFYPNDRKRRISVARAGDHLSAFATIFCTYRWGACPLSGGLLVGTTIMCQCHGSKFDVTTGAVVSGPAVALAWLAP